MYILAVIALAASVSGGGNNVTASFQEFNSVETCQYAQKMLLDIKQTNNVNVNAVCIPK